MLDPGAPIKALFHLLRGEVRVCGVARVRRYVPGEPTADVDLLVQEDRLLSSGRKEVPPMSMDGCPVLWPAGGGRALTMGLRKDDLVLVLYRHRSHDEIDSGEEGPLVPGSTRRMSVADVVVLPGYVCPTTGMASGAFHEDGEPVLSMPENEALHVGDSGATYLLVREDLLIPHLEEIHDALSGHTHGPGTYSVMVGGVPTSPTGFSGPADIYAAPGSMSSSRIKVDD